VSDAFGALDSDLGGDLLVAGVSACATVTLVLVARVLLDLPLGPIPRLAPLAVYPLYLLLGRGDTGSVLERPGLWAAVSVLVAVGVLGVALA